jgi:hypothetical protein
MPATVCRAVTGAGTGFTTATGQCGPVSQFPIATSRGRHAPRPSNLIRSIFFQRKLGVIITNRVRISNILIYSQS